MTPKPVGKAADMSSRERVSAALHRQPVDHLPLCVEALCHGFVRFVTERLPDPFERATYYAGLGLDAGVSLDTPLCLPEVNPEIQIRHWREQPAGEPYPLLGKEYRTPKGTLRQVVVRTEDYEHDYFSHGRDTLDTFSDYHVPAHRSRQYLVEKEADLEALACLLRPLAGQALAEYRAKARQAREFCDRRQLTFAAYHLGVGDPIVWMSGVERTLEMAMAEKALFRRYVDLVAGRQRQVLELALEAGAQHVVRRGIYESTDFWSPALFREFLFEPLRQEVTLCHQAEATVDYVMLSGQMPLLGEVKAAGIDMLSNLDPQANGTDLGAIRATIGDSVTLCGGVNNYLVLEKGTAEEVRRAVREALAVFTPTTGCILAPSDCILSYDDAAVAERNFHTMLDSWRAGP